MKVAAVVAWAEARKPTDPVVWGVSGDAARGTRSEDTVKRLAKDVDEIVCLRAPPFFVAVGQFYARFDPVEDEDVLEILKEG